MSGLATVAVMVLALAGDVLFGDPPNRFHPVAWTGRGISAVQNLTRFRNNAMRFFAGLLLVTVGAAGMAVIGWLSEYVSRQGPVSIAILGQAILLKATFSVRALGSAAGAVANALRNGELSSARHLVAYHLVSRDVSTLDASQLSAATIGSVAENTNDSVVAPLFYFAIAGLPGILVYRFVNTCDAMLGYRTDELEWYGKAAARCDDLLNFIPARLTAAVMLLCGRFFTPHWRSPVATWWRDHRLTTSPNAGHPMSAAAGVIGVALEKRGHYLLGGQHPKPSVAAIEQVVSLLWATAVIFTFVQSMVLVYWTVG